MWERGWSFIRKAGTIILLSTIVVWFTTYFGFADGTFRMLSEEELDYCVNGNVETEINAALSNSLGFGGHNATICMKKITD